MPGAVVELSARWGSMRHRIGVPERYASTIVPALHTALPQLHAAVTQRVLPSSLTVWRFRRPDRFPLATDRTESSVRSFYAVLGTALSGSEEVLLQWVLDCSLAPSSVVSGTTTGGNGSPLLAPLLPPRDLTSVELRRMQSKQSLPGWRLSGRIAIAADAPRRNHLLQQVLGALRLAQAPGARLELSRSRTATFVSATAGMFSTVSANVAELVMLAALPVGEQPNVGILRQRHRLLRMSPSWPQRGLVLGMGVDDRSVRLPTSLATMHVALTGPTGTGKSVVLGHLIEQALGDGHGLVCVDPKQDLVEAALARVPLHRRDDVVILDPLDAQAVVGLNPLVGTSPELAADGLLNIFKQLYGDLIGPRSTDLLHASLLTLARVGGQSLVSLPVLLTNSDFRRRLLANLPHDPILRSVWEWYDNLSTSERATVQAPLLNKIRPLLYRQGLRRVLGQPQPRFDIAEVLTDRKVLLVSLARGTIGPEGANLLGAVVVNQLWRAIEGRAAIPPEHRRPVYVVLDEFADFLALPVDLGDALAKARGLGAGFVLAHQHLAQLTAAMRASVMTNARNRIAFTAPADDARVFASMTSGLLGADDFMRLPKYETYVHLVDHGWASMSTLPPTEPSSDPARLRELSRERFGLPVIEIDAAAGRLLDGEGDGESPPLGRRRRA